MATKTETYEYIVGKAESLKKKYPVVNSRSIYYLFSLLCVITDFYKNPSYVLPESEFDDVVVDSTNDGGVDILLTEPNAETDNLIIGQSKLKDKISTEEITNAVIKMTTFYRNMIDGKYDVVNEKVQRRFLSLHAEIGEESKIKFVFYTSAPKRRINTEKIERVFRWQFPNSDNMELYIMFDSDIKEQITEYESRQPNIERGKILIDKENNCLRYGTDSIIVNASALSFKKLYALHSINLLSYNLRYHIKGGTIDKDIKDSIENNPESFWMKNNGITIICDDFSVVEREVHLRNFSVINGGQTVYLLSKSKFVNEEKDFYIVCKIIKNTFTNIDDKIRFNLDIAKATNAQKAIKQMDLKANAPEQFLFAQEMKSIGVFYRTKRGEVVPKKFQEKYLNTNLTEVGKLCLTAIFQAPCLGRTKTSAVYSSKYYNCIFGNNRLQVAAICKELLYMNYYFEKIFITKFEKDVICSTNKNMLPFARNARTICIAFTALAARYHQGNINDDGLIKIFAAANSQSESTLDSLYKTCSELGDIKSILPKKINDDKNKLNGILYELFSAIITNGTTVFTMATQFDPTLIPSNYLKIDKNYYFILQNSWSYLKTDITRIFADIK